MQACGAGQPEQVPDPPPSRLGFEVQERTVQRVAGGAWGHRDLQGLSVESA